ncbi:Lin0512 family protein [Coprothermobacter platensis]|uniref:Lin0512 family protein n=1 Tax=Coprothermobacter platensis TaxID=108819 RepID=UPI000369CEAA|nr:Lin0512 family protein [Coprothermobacter platensis]
MAWHRLLVEMGMGVDQHGQDPTRACQKAIKDAMHRVCIPSLVEADMFGNNDVKLTVDLAVPGAATVDIEKLRQALPLKMDAEFMVQEGGMKAKGVVMEELEDKSDDMFIAVAAVTVWVSTTGQTSD